MSVDRDIEAIIAERHLRGLSSLVPTALSERTGLSPKNAISSLWAYSRSVGLRNLSPLFILEREDPHESKDITDLVSSIADLEQGGVEVEGFVWHQEPIVATMSNTYLVFQFSEEHAARLTSGVNTEGKEEFRGEQSPRQ